MDSKYVRKTVENLLAELEKNPAIGRRPSPSFMRRYGRPLGLGIALGVSGAVGCSGSSETKDALPGPKDAYGVSDIRPVDINKDAPGLPSDASDAGAREVLAESKDVLPGPIDVYGGPADVMPMVDTRDALPNDVPVYGLAVGRIDAGDAQPSDTQDAQPPSPEVSREAPPRE